VNPPSLLQIVERLEYLSGKLPSRIRKAVLWELTPLKQLFLQQRTPRFLFTGSGRTAAMEIVGALFGQPDFGQTHHIPARLCRWFDVTFPDRGKVSILDARAADDSAAVQIRDEIKRQPADIIFFLDNGQNAGPTGKSDLDNLTGYLTQNEIAEANSRIIGLVIPPPGEAIPRDQIDRTAIRLRSALRSNLAGHESILEVLKLAPSDGDHALQLPDPEAQRLMSILARELPNEARMEMIRISRNRQAQHEVAQLLVKSTTAICAAIGAQPIPLADLPVLTSLQIMMISGIMYVSGRERSLRAATEFLGALGANVGAAMLLREGTRAVLKFFPGWGNVVCGLVAGSGTYAIGRAAIVFFIDGVSLKDARRTYLAARKKRRHPALPTHE
jgi:uncharacterized protein (DUF697 family)